MIRSTGIGSGLDIESLVTQLVAAERTPKETRLNAQQGKLQNQLSAIGAVKGALGKFQSTLADLKSAEKFEVSKASVSGDAVQVSAGKGAANGTYDIEVSRLATAHGLASGVFSSADAVVGTGTLTFRFGTTAYDPQADVYGGFVVNAEQSTATLMIDTSNNTLAGVRDAINAADMGVNAAVVNDGTGYRLVLSSANTGAANGMEISVADDDSGNADANGLSQLAFGSAATNMTQTRAGIDALLSINGLPVSSAGNKVAEAVEGLTLTLTSVTNTPAQVIVADDSSGLKSAVTAFVSAYNGLVATAASVASYDPATRAGGPLLGDAALRSVLGQVRQTLGSVSGGGDAVKSLADIGITTQKDGKLAIDETRLTTVLSNHFEEVAALFTAHGDTSDSLLGYAGASARTAAGTHAVGVTRIASQGTLAGAGVLPNFGIGSAVTIDGSNDTLALRVNGIETGTITLTGGVYASGEALAEQIQARINADANLKAANVATLVEYDSAANRLVLRSDRHGADSQIEVLQTGATSAATLGLAVAMGVPGVDVAGTLGGFTATGLGRTLTGAANTPSEGLKVDVLGGTTGARGPVTFSRGIADRLDTLVTQLLADGGALDARSDGLQSRVEDIGDQRDALDLRMTAVEARLRTQFTALDSLMAQLQKTSSFLDQQLKSLPGANTGSDN